VTSGNPIAVWSQFISGVNAINPLFAFYDIHGGKREVPFFYFVTDMTYLSKIKSALRRATVEVKQVSQGWMDGWMGDQKFNISSSVPRKAL
jgi:hypothetical protein